MVALSDINVLRGMANNEIFVEPFNAPDLGSASYDVHLGKYYYQARLIKPTTLCPELYNIYSEADVKKVWGDVIKAGQAFEWKRAVPKADWSNIHDDDLIIMLAPRANLLCHTYEFIGAAVNSTTMMKARSSIGRSLVNVCQCAGMGDVGFFNRWTMELYNRDEWHIPLVVHRRIAQIVFLETGPTEKVYISKYQETGVLADLMANWKPSDMLPKLHMDRDIQRGFVAVDY